MTADGIESTRPLGPLQEVLLVGTLLDTRSGFEVIQLHALVEERLDEPRLVDAWRRVMARHPVFRTSFR